MHMVVANAVGVTTGETNGERVLRNAVELTPQVRLVAVCEADDVSRKDGPVLPDPWRIFHRGQDEAKDGVLLAYDSDHVHPLADPTWTLTCPAKVAGHPPSDTKARWALTVPMLFGYRTQQERQRKVTVVHFVPRRSPRYYWQLQASEIRHLDPDIVGSDTNSNKPELRDAFPKRKIRLVRGDVMGFVIRAGVPCGLTARGRRVGGSDHLAGVLTV